MDLLLGEVMRDSNARAKGSGIVGIAPGFRIRPKPGAALTLS